MNERKGRLLVVDDETDFRIVLRDHFEASGYEVLEAADGQEALEVFHKGPYPQKELYKYYSQGSVFCLASIQDGFAMVQTQAAACGSLRDLVPAFLTNKNSSGFSHSEAEQ